LILQDYQLDKRINPGREEVGKTGFHHQKLLAWLVSDFNKQNYSPKPEINDKSAAFWSIKEEMYVESTVDICKVEFSYSRKNELKLTIPADYA
jgi:hypothetical protein